MKYPKEKYTIIKHQHPIYNGVEIIAVSSYAGKAVKGKAICHANDTFNEEKGIELAIARCAHKIALKRVKRANRKLAEARVQEEAAVLHCKHMAVYCLDADTECEQTAQAIKDLEKELG